MDRLSAGFFSCLSLARLSGAGMLLLALCLGTCTPDDPPRILVFSKTAGYRHASIPNGMAALRKICRENGMVMDSTENATDFNEKNLRRYAAVVFLSTTGDVLDPEQETAFERYIQAGGGFVGVHAASDTEYQWGWYGGLVGGYFDNHPDIQDATLQVVQHDHPATRHLGNTWKRHDEWYNLRDLNPNVEVLLKIDESSYQGGTMGADHPMSWYHEYDGGRAFYTALGHTEASYAEPEFLQHILGGLKYAIGKKKRLNYALCRTPEYPDPTRFVKTVLASNLNEPMEFEMLPDGRILFIERRGLINVFNPNTALVRIVYKLPVHDRYEDGLLGLALDPNWKTNHQIYLYYSPAGEKAVNRLSRFFFDGDTFDRASEQPLLEVAVQRDECCHTGGSIEFDADGFLYLSTGDNTNPFESRGFAPIDEQPGRSPWDAQKSSANTMDLRGKILRIKPLDDGSYICPAGNLFTPEDIHVQAGEAMPTTSALAGRPEIYVMGCRNPFRISLDSRKKRLFWGEVGPDSGEPDTTRGPEGYDEVNCATAAGFFGWPYFVGNNLPYRDYDFQSGVSGTAFNPGRPQNHSANNTGATELPPAQPALIWYPYGNSATFPLLGNGSRNAMAGPVYYCDAYPATTRLPDYYEGKLLIYDWMRNWIMAVTLDSLDRFSRLEPFANYIKMSRPMDMLVDPGGVIWILEYGKTWFSANPDARISRIDYVRGNRPPLPVLQADKIAGAAPCTIVFSASESLDLDGQELRYTLDFGDDSPPVTVSDRSKRIVRAGLDGQPASSTHPADSLAHTYQSAGTYTAQLTVTDSKGATATVRTRILIGNSPPVVYWDLGQRNRSFYVPGDTLQYRLIVTDPEDGSLYNGKISAATVTRTIDYLEGGFDMTLIAEAHQTALQQADFARGKVLIDRADCSACHATDRQVNGPAYRAIARRYRDSQHAVRDLSAKVIKGGTGNWGHTPMSAHPLLSESDAGEMVRWILSLEEVSRPQKNVPLAGKYPLTTHRQKTEKKKAAPGTYILQASYRDRGTALQQPILGQEILALRPAFQQAEQADSMSNEIRQYRPYKGDTVVLHELRHNSFFMYRHCDLRGVYSVAVGLGSGDKRNQVEGGRIELRIGSPAGPLAGTAPIPARNPAGRMEFSEAVIPVNQRLWPHGHACQDLYFVLKNENYPSRQVGVVDWIRFNL